MERDGGAAEYVLAPAEALVAAPTSVPLADAAGLPSVALTAWQALFDDGALQAGQRVLINGAGGVVGKYAIALAKRAGVHVVATASPRSADAVRAAGAEKIVDHTKADVLSAVDQSSPRSSRWSATAAGWSARPRSWPRPATRPVG